MSGTDRYTSRCPVCDSPLELDKDRGYSCARCGWDESSQLEGDEVWIVPDEQGDAEDLD